MSAEELAAIAAQMGIETLDPSYMGATLVIEGVADFTHVPPSSRLQAATGGYRRLQAATGGLWRDDCDGYGEPPLHFACAGD